MAMQTLTSPSLTLKKGDRYYSPAFKATITIVGGGLTIIFYTSVSDNGHTTDIRYRGKVEEIKKQITLNHLILVT